MKYFSKHLDKKFKLSLICSAIAMVSTSSIAEDVQGGDASEDDKIEVIMVTAQKRIQRIIDVPTSIAAVTADVITKSGSQQIADVQDLVPNLTIQDTNSFNNQVSIRGVGSSSRNISFDTRVGVYLDGVYLGQSPGLNQDLMDVERIEVLRGPQGSLFGKNTVAGAINIITKKPSDELEGKVKARVGNYNSQQYSGYINVPLNDDIALKVSASSMQRDGFVENVYPGAEGDVGNRDNITYRAQLYVDTFEDLELTFTLDGSSADETPLFGEHTTDFIAANVVEEQAKEKRVTYNDILATEDRSTSGLALEALYDFEHGGSFKSITAQRETKLNFISDLDYSSLDFFTLDYVDEYDQFTQEFQYTSKNDDTFEYIVGLYYYQQDSLTDRRALSGSETVPVSDATFLKGLLDSLNLDTLVGTPYEFLYPSGSVIHAGTVDTLSYAIFTNMTYHFTDDWQLGVGLRWGKESKEVDWAIDGSTSGYFALATDTYVDKISESDFLPSLSLNYNIGDNTVSYFRYATGSKSGGYNLDYVTPAQMNFLEFDKETSVNYELGIKGYNDDHTFNYAVTLFTTEYTDYQQQQFIDIGDSRTILVISNAASVSTQGVEVELTAAVTDNFTVGFSASYLDAKFDEFKRGGTADDPDVSGKRLPGAAEVQAVMTFDYIQEFGENGNWFAHADISYTGDQYTTPNNVKTAPLLAGGEIDFGYAPSRTLANARIGVEFESWSASLWARNLTDSDETITSRRQFFGGVDETYVSPRTYGVELTYSF